MAYKADALSEDILVKKEANCATSVNYITSTVAKIFLPSVWVENMPKKLVTKEWGGWEILEIDERNLKPGDLIFVKTPAPDRDRSIEITRSISHVAIAIKTNRVFHCCMQVGTGLTEGLGSFFGKYEQVKTKAKMLMPDLPRNDALLAQISSFEEIEHIVNSSQGSCEKPVVAWSSFLLVWQRGGGYLTCPTPDRFS